MEEIVLTKEQLNEMLKTAYSEGYDHGYIQVYSDYEVTDSLAKLNELFEEK